MGRKYQATAHSTVIADRTASVLFAFDRFDASAIEEGAESITKIAEQIKKSGATTPINRSGFTDPLGKFSYNQKLSSQRANTVAKLLVQQGIEANRIQIQANSQTDLYKQCSGNNSSQLIQCLAPNDVLISIGKTVCHERVIILRMVAFFVFKTLKVI